MSKKILPSWKLYNWKVRVYNSKDKIIDSWIIKERTEQQAGKEAEAEVERISEANDWTMTKA